MLEEDDDGIHDYGLYQSRYAPNASLLTSLDPSIPFDCQSVLSADPLIFGFELLEPEGPDVGAHVRFNGGPITNADGSETTLLKPQVGVIAAQAYGRIVIAFEHPFGQLYLGWVTPDAYEIIHVHAEPNTWIH